MKAFAVRLYFLGMLLALLAACSGTPSSRFIAPVVQPTGFEPDVPRYTGIGTAKQSRLAPAKRVALITETFANIATGANDWIYSAPSCLTAGASPPPGSIPPCGSLARQDRPGHGALQLTPAVAFMLGLVGWYQPLPTANGLQIRFTLYDFSPSATGHSDGSLLYFTDGAQTPPTQGIGEGGCLGYFWVDGWCGGPGGPGQGLANAYLGVAFDEYGNFSTFINGGPGLVPNTVALGGAASTSYHYLGGVTNAQGQPASLPFALGVESRKRPHKSPTVEVSLAKTGIVEVAIDSHDGHGFVTYLATSIVGISGQPAVPDTVYVGFIGSCGAGFDIHQINDVTISTLH